jgi:serine/threonine protein kinase
VSRLLSRGAVVDRYEVEGFIGEGGLSEVYRVKHRDLGSTHALKVLALDLPHIHSRILAEGRVQAKLKHPNVVAVSDVVDVDGRPGLVMEFVDGVSLREWLLVHEPTLDEALRIFTGVVRGVRAAHRIGLAHRDIKPENILLADTEAGLVPKVMDFGLVKILTDDQGATQTGVMMGTPQYMAPEQIRDASRVDQRADLFSLGALLYGMICGVPAFRGSDVVTILNRTAAGEYTDPKTIRPDLPDHVASVIRDLLKTNPDERIQSCDLLLERLFPRGVGKTGDDIVALPVEAPAATAPAPVALGDLPTEPGARHVGPVVYDDEVTIPAPPPPPKSNRDPNAPMPAAAVGWLAAAGGVVLLGMGVLVGLVV